MKRFVFYVGGPAFHPVAAQAGRIIEWLGDAADYEVVHGVAAFDRLKGCDLLVLMGLHWTGHEGTQWGPYRPLGDPQKAAFERYVSSGRPLMVHHGSVASYNDWPRFNELVGVKWVRGQSTHSPFHEFGVTLEPTGHPVVEGVASYRLEDELYYNLDLMPGYEPQVHAWAEWEGERRPMIVTGEGGRVVGAGRMVYLANGHDLRAFECPAMKQLWLNSIGWLTGE